MIPLIPWITALEAAMMGRRCGDQASLFYQFRLDERVPRDHLLRRIDRFVTAALRFIGFPGLPGADRGRSCLCDC